MKFILTLLTLANAASIAPASKEQLASFLKRLGPYDSGNDYMTLYLADIDNDGRRDYVFVAHGGTLRTQTIAEVYADGEDGGLVTVGIGKATWAAKPQVSLPIFFDDPFLTVVNDKTFMHFTETTRKWKLTYVWENGRIRFLGKKRR